MRSLTRKLAFFLERTQFDGLPKKVINEAKLSILDTLGCALAGSIEPSTKTLVELLKETGGKEESTILVYGDKVPAQSAVLANGTMTGILELDDIVLLGGHSGVNVVPAALAIGEHKSSGTDLILAVALGYEVCRRVGQIIRPDAFYNGFHISGLIGAFGAAATAGKLLDFDEDKFTNALGICSLTPLAMLEYCSKGGTVKDLIYGWSGQVGVIASLLTQKGFTGPETLIEGEQGLLRCVTGKYPLPQQYQNLFLEGIGKDWALLQTLRKTHASCTFTFSSLEATQSIMREADIKIGDVERITITTQTLTHQLCREKELRDVISARFSIPYLVGIMLKENRSVTPDLIEKNLGNSEISSFMDKVNMVVDKRLDPLYAYPPKGKGYLTSIVRINTKDGRKLRKRVDIVRGDPRNPLSKDELTEKFKILASRAIDPDRTSDLVQILRKLEDLRRVSDLVKLMIAKC